MKNQFVSYGIALKLKEKGMDEECFAYFNGDTPYRIGGEGTKSVDKLWTYRNTFLSSIDSELVISPEPEDANDTTKYRRLKWGIKVAAPIYQQVFSWLLKKYNIHCHFPRVYRCRPLPKEFEGFCVYIDNGKEEELEINNFFLTNLYKTFEEAQDACIEKLLELI